MSDPPTHRTAVLAAALLTVAGATVLATSGSVGWGLVRAGGAVVVGGVVVWLQRQGGNLAGWSAVALGIIALPATAAIAGDHLTGAQVPRGIAAGVAALAAAVLLVTGAVILIRAVPGWWRLLAIPVAALLLQFAAIPIGFAVLVTNRAPTPLAGASPADRELTYTDVTLTTSDGVTLAAWYLPGGNATGVLLLHGAGTNKASTLAHAQVLVGMGYDVLALDARGHGDSEGTAMDLGWHSSDVIAAIDWLVANDVAPVGVVGLSMGGEQALTAAAADPRIRVVVAEGVGVRVAGDVPPEEAGGLAGVVNAVNFAVTDLLTTATPPPPLPDVVRAIEPPRQVLLIAGRGEAEHARWLQGASSGNVTVWEVDAAHTAALAADPQEWRSRVGVLLGIAIAYPVGA